MTRLQRLPQASSSPAVFTDGLDTWEDKTIGRKAEYKRVIKKYDPTTLKWTLVEQEEYIAEDARVSICMTFRLYSYKIVNPIR